MIKQLIKNNEQSNIVKNTTTINHKKLTISDIEKFYFNKKTNSFKFGLEYERISLDKTTYDVVSYEKIAKIIEHFAKISNWELIYNSNILIGAKNKNNTMISLEPGNQMELSLQPFSSIVDIELHANKILKLLDKIADIYNVIFLPYGVNPKNCADEIPLLNKARYNIMDNILPFSYNGELVSNMMKKTASIQVNVDYKNQTDAYYKVKFLNLIMPFMTALCANSSFENGKLSSNKTNRAYIIRHSGDNRFNLFYKNVFYKFFNKHSNFFKNYIMELLNVPMLYIERNNNVIEINGKINFYEFMKHGYKSYYATYDDYLLHQSLVFPDVRLKNYIEIRNHDSANMDMALSLIAFYKGILSYDINFLLSKFNYLKFENIEKYHNDIIKNGFNSKVNNELSCYNVVLELFNLSKYKLNSKERAYLKPILNMLITRKTNADIILDYDIKKVSDLVDFLM